MGYTIIRSDGTHPGFKGLIRELDRELRARESDHEDIYIAHNRVPENVHVVLALHDDLPVGCACLRAMNENTVELKRMFVRPEHRGNGVSRRILADLEAWALEMSYKSICLETGYLLKAAHGLYTSAGFRLIENFGPYKGIQESICMEKVLIDRDTNG